MLLKERIKEKETILEFVFLLKVDFNCNVTSLAQYPITGVSTSLSLMSSNNRVEYSAGCTLYSYLRNILYVITLDLFHISYLSCSKASFGFAATKVRDNAAMMASRHPTFAPPEVDGDPD